MSGVAAALLAGVGFGVFQAVNRRANQLIDAYRGTFGLLLVAVVVVAAATVVTQDLDAVATAPVSSFAAFAAAGVIHFFFGWTFLGLSQQRIGASRTGVAIAATPLIGSILAALVLDEPLSALIIVGVSAVVVGVALIATRTPEQATWKAGMPWFALGAALSWGSSPLFIRWGLSGLPIPLFGVTVGLAAAATLYAVALRLRLANVGGPAPRAAVPWVGLGAVLVGIAITSQWIAYDLIEISVAITLMQLATPVVVLIAPLIVGSEMERITWRLVAGMIAIVGGSVLVVLTAGA